MFDPKSNYALNKKDPEAIVCPSATGVHIRLTREDFSSEEEFRRWKDFSDEDYKDTESAGRSYYDNCIPLDDARKSTNISAEDAILAPLEEAEHRTQQAALLQQVRSVLTKTQYRRLWLYLVDGLTVKQIAQQEGVTFQAVYACFVNAKRNVNNL